MTILPSLKKQMSTGAFLAEMYLSTRLSPSSARRVQVLVPSVAIGPVMFSKLVMFPLSASNEPEKEDLKELNGKLNDYHEMVRQLEAVKSTMTEEIKRYDSELVRLENAEMEEDVDRGLKQARRAIADLERVIDDETNDIIEEKEDEFVTIAEFEESNKVAKHAPKDDDSDLDNNHIIPAVVDVVAKQNKQDKKKSSAAKVGEELESIEKKKHELKSFEKKELQEISVSENTMPAGGDDLSITLEWDTESEEDDVDHDSDECLDPVDSIEKKEQDLERIDDDESPFSTWNKKMSGFALL